jgi:hypothetical protein
MFIGMIRTTTKATMIAMTTTPAIPPPMAPTSVPVLMALDVPGGEVCMVSGWEVVAGAVAVTKVTLGGGVVEEEEEEEEEVVVVVEG